MSIAPETRARLEQLIAKWNEPVRAAEWAAREAWIQRTQRQCADELTALLSSLEPPQAQEPSLRSVVKAAIDRDRKVWPQPHKAVQHSDVAATFDERSDPRAMLAFIRLVFAPSVPPQEEQS